MKTGNLNQRVTFQRKSRVNDGQGGAVESWVDVVTVWAGVKALSGRERDSSEQTESPRNYRVTVRRSSDTAAITSVDRIVWRGKNLNIRFIPDEGPTPKFMTFDCEEGVAH